MQDVVWHQTKITTQLHCMGCDIGGVQLLYWSFHANVASILANHKIPSSRISFRWHANHEWSIKLGRDKKNCCPSNPFRWHCQDNCYDWSINLSVGNVFCRSVCGNVSSMWIAIRFIGSVFFSSSCICEWCTSHQQSLKLRHRHSSAHRLCTIEG